ncbi:MAG: 2Fe-2S iron-sulfur cluster-binding protein [Gemmatales bacterium]
MSKMSFKVWRGDKGQGEFKEYTTEVTEGMVVLDAMHQIQAENAHDLALRWNCKAGKCGSCTRRDQRHAQTHVHDADQVAADRSTRDRRTDAGLPPHA